MKNLRTIMTTCFLVVLFAAPGSIQAVSMGSSDGYDLDKLWSRAQKQYNLAEQDAVLLLESRHISILASGEKRTAIRRVVWIGTAAVVRRHADLRVPWNSSKSNLTVKSLRTWRDNTWWPHPDKISETATVETLPFTLGQADDYTDMRETMLLHDGIEVPCIMETFYEIVEQSGAAGESDGLWIFPQHDPAVLVELSVSVPAKAAFSFHNDNGTPDPNIRETDDQTITYKWKMENLDRLGTPHIDDPAGYAPYVIWSTWPDWESLGLSITDSFDRAAVLSDALADTVAGLVEHQPTAAARARKIAAYVDESTRSIHYDPRFWLFSPRPASRTWETAYGHSLDRAVLAAAMFREAGLSAEPVFRSSGVGDIVPDVPGLSRLGHLEVLISGDQIQAFYDPESGTLTDGLRPMYGRTVWKPVTDDFPAMLPNFNRLETASLFELILTIEPGKDGDWKGTGYLSTNGLFCLYDQMVGLDNKALGLINRVAGSALPGAEVTGYNLEVFDFDQVTLGFELNLSAPEPDDQGRIRFTISDPAGGIFAQLPTNVHLYQEHRSSPVFLAGKMTQQVTLRIKTGDRETVYLPEAGEINGQIGLCSFTVTSENGWTTITRELRIGAHTVASDQWGEFRALLLEDKDPAGRTLLLLK